MTKDTETDRDGTENLQAAVETAAPIIMVATKDRGNAAAAGAAWLTSLWSKNDGKPCAKNAAKTSVAKTDPEAAYKDGIGIAIMGGVIGGAGIGYLAAVFTSVAINYALTAVDIGFSMGIGSLTATGLALVANRMLYNHRMRQNDGPTPPSA